MTEDTLTASQPETLTGSAAPESIAGATSSTPTATSTNPVAGQLVATGPGTAKLQSTSPVPELHLTAFEKIITEVKAFFKSELTKAKEEIAALEKRLEYVEGRIKQL